MQEQERSEGVGRESGSVFDRAAVLSCAKTVLAEEAAALLAASRRLAPDFAAAVELLSSCTGKVVTTGLGKSGHVAGKVASTLSSTGTPSFFMHPTESQHGDFGMLAQGDAVVAFAFGGETREVVQLARQARSRGLPVIAVTGVLSSSLARQADYVLDGSVDREADTLGLAPTTSSTVALAMGDALAVALMQVRGFTREGFAELHPGGRLGRSLARVGELMHARETLRVVSPEARFSEVLAAVTQPNFGIVGVEADGELVGAISDGDLRRALLNHDAEALSLSARDIMTPTPRVVPEDMRGLEAVALMQEHAITSLFVSDDGKQLRGLVRLHDLLNSGVL